VLAANMGAGQPEAIPQTIGERQARLGFDFNPLSINLEYRRHTYVPRRRT
jgi:hypothetical protein